MKRRHFLCQFGLGATAALLAGRATGAPMPVSGLEQNVGSPHPFPPPQAPAKKYRAAAIGSTGHGNFGHGLDRVFVDLPGVEFVAIADDNPAGLEAAGKRNSITRLYTDYKAMLQNEQLDIISVAMRHSERHKEIVLACAKAGKHMFCEKPLAPDLASADRMQMACRKHGVKLAIAVQNRMSPAVLQAKRMVEDGRLGKLLSLRGCGKEDHRGGGEDLMVLGFHIFDLMNYFAGRPLWTFANVLTQGREVTRADRQAGQEPNGWVAGDGLMAMYGFANAVYGTFESHRDVPGGEDRFSLEIRGSKGMIALRSLADAVWFQGPIFNPAKPHTWQPITTLEWEAVPDKMHWCNQKLVLDLLHAIEENREPVASLDDAIWALEMIQSAYASHLKKARVDLPLKNRKHPLG
jgi:predicted dehydrogenase